MKSVILYISKLFLGLSLTIKLPKLKEIRDYKAAYVEKQIKKDFV